MFSGGFGDAFGRMSPEVYTEKAYLFDKFLRSTLSGKLSAEKYGAVLKELAEHMGYRPGMFVGFGDFDFGNFLERVISLLVYIGDSEKMRVVHENMNGLNWMRNSGVSLWLTVLFSGEPDTIRFFAEKWEESGFCGITTGLLSEESGFGGCSVPIDNLCYWLMISGAYRYIPDIFVQMMNYCAEDEKIVVLSAVKFRDGDFLREIMDRGYTVSADTFMEIIRDKDALEWFAGEYGCEGESVSDMLRNMFDDEQLFRMVKRLSACGGEREADLSVIPRISKFRFSDPFEFFTDEQLNIISKYAGKIFASDVTVDVTGSAEIANAARIFDGTDCKVHYRVCLESGYYTVRDYIGFMQNGYELIFGDDCDFFTGLPCTLLRMLDANSKTLYKNMIKYGVINSDNLNSVLEYLIDSKLINGISVINKEHSLLCGSVGG